MASTSHRRPVPSFWRRQLSRVVLPTVGLGALAVAGAAALSHDEPAAAEPRRDEPLVAVAEEPTVVSRGGERPAFESGASVAERVQGRWWVVEATPLRADASPDGVVLAELTPGTAVAVTGVVEGEWVQVIHHDQPRWIAGTALSETEPAPEPPPPPPVEVRAGTPCDDGSAVERGLRPDTVAVYRAVCSAFPAVDSWGGLRGDGEHGAGRALDIMVSGAAGTEIAEWVRAHADELGVSEVIYEQRIWTQERSGDGWRGMEDRGSATANHFDHVHVTTYGDSAG